MESIHTKTRIKKTAEQVAILNQMRDEGMTSSRDKAKVAEAAKRTNLPKRVVKQWIDNKRKPKRGATKKRSSKPSNLYTAFMAGPFTEQELQYLAEGKTLGEITKIRAARYRELQKTAEGRKFLEENLHKDNNISREDLTDAQLNGRVNGIIHAIETEAEKLQSLGYTCVAIVAQPHKPPIVVGAPEGVFFFQNRTKITEDFDDYIVKEGKGTQDSKPVMARRIQHLFNQLYAQASGVSDAVVPYAAIERGLPIHMTGLPEGIPFKKPGSYRVDQMKLILQIASGLSVTIGREPRNSSSSQQDTVCTGVPVDDRPNPATPTTPSGVPVDDRPATAITTPSGVPVDDRPNPATPTTPSAGVPMDDEPHCGSPASTTAEDILSTISSQLGVDVPLEDDGVIVDTEAPSASEALSYAKQLARQAQNAQTQKKVPRRNRSKLVGKEINHLWKHGKGKKATSKWYRGVILRREGKMYHIHYEDKKNPQTVSVKDFNKFRRKKTLVFL